MNPQPSIRAQGLCRRQGLRWVLVHLDFTLNAGEALLLAGGNGAGKSTLLRLLSTLTPPSQGSLELFGQSVRTHRSTQRTRIGFLGHTNQLYNELTPNDHLRLWTKLGDATRTDLMENSATSILEQVNLETRQNDPVRTFSAGMRKRLALARMILLNPDLILLDEPFGQLDAQGVELMHNTVQAWRAQGKSLVLATHLLDRGKPLCDRALVLAHGRQIWSGEASQLTSTILAGAPS